MRLQKILAQQGYGSRRAVETWIESGRICVNGTVAKLGQKVSETDVIDIDGKKVNIKVITPKLILFHKPVGVECTMAKVENGKSLKDFNFGSERVFPVGRLDKNSRGLLILTNDGELANRLAHPRYEHEKEYIVTVDKPISQSMLASFSSGIEIDKKITKPCIVKKINPKVFRVVLQEGRNRQIRKMCATLGLEVVDLLRVRIQNFRLDDIGTGLAISVKT